MVNKRVVLINSFCDKQNKIDVFKDGVLVARIGDVDYLDYHLYLKGERAGTARRLQPRARGYGGPTVAGAGGT